MRGKRQLPVAIGGVGIHDYFAEVKFLDRFTRKTIVGKRPHQVAYEAC